MEGLNFVFLSLQSTTLIPFYHPVYEPWIDISPSHKKQILIETQNSCEESQGFHVWQSVIYWTPGENINKWWIIKVICWKLTGERNSVYTRKLNTDGNIKTIFYFFWGVQILKSIEHLVSKIITSTETSNIQSWCVDTLHETIIYSQTTLIDVYVQRNLAWFNDGENLCIM